MKNEKLQLKIKSWIKQNRVEFALLLFIIVLASFFRLWRINEYLPFLGDEGRDVRVVSRFLEHFDLMFVGPRTSIGNMYLGPLYYYFMAPFLLLFNFSPTGPAVGVAIAGITTVFLMWFVAREWFGKVAAVIASLLYAISPMVISLSKHSWNPNIMPFFSLLSIYSIWRVCRKKEYKWLIILGISLAFILQSHYLGLLLIPTIAIIWIITWVAVRNKKQEVRKFLSFSFFAFSLFVFLMSPLVIFDAKHGWRNLDAMKVFFTERQTTVSAKPWSGVHNLWPLFSEEIIPTIFTVKNENAAKTVSILLVLSTIYILSLSKKTAPFFLQNAPFFLITTWIVFGLIGLGNYKQSIFSHYYGFMFTAPFLLLGGITQKLWDKNYKWAVFLPAAFLVAINLLENPLKYSPQRQMQRVQKIDQKIIEESEGRQFNFGIIAKRNYEEGYLYFFERWRAPVLEIDSQRANETITNQLFVVCEDSVCEPINNPKAEIANFGWSKVDREWEVDGVRLFKLIHTEK